MEQQVRFLGFAADEHLPAIYTLASCLAYPSFYEGFGLPVLEAMACGTPVVASQSSSLPEVAGPAAILVDPHDADSLVDALDRVLFDDALRAELRAAGRERAQHFTWERAAQELVAAYRSVADRAV